MAQWVEWSSPLGWESHAEPEMRHMRTYGPIWTSMPLWIRRKLIDGRQLNKLMLVDAIRRFWDGEWRSTQLPDWQDQKRLVDATERANQIQRLVEAGRLSLDRRSAFAEVLRRFGWRSNR